MRACIGSATRSLVTAVATAALFSVAAPFAGCSKDTKLRISHLSPDEGPPGRKVIIHGSGFQHKGMKRVEVFFGDYRAEVKGFDGDDKLIVVAPSGPKLGETVSVLVNFIGRGSNADPLKFKYQEPPKRLTASDLVGDKKDDKKKDKKKDKKDDK